MISFYMLSFQASERQSFKKQMQTLDVVYGIAADRGLPKKMLLAPQNITTGPVMPG